MNILVIGNGFDLAHGLPTRYADFLKFCGKVIALKGPSVESHLQSDDFFADIPDRLKDAIREPYNYYDPESPLKHTYEISLIKKFCDYIECNFWYNHFSTQFNQTDSGKNWIDFESEIGRIVRILSDNIKENWMHDRASSLISELYSSNISTDKFKDKKNITIRAFLNTLESDLNNFINALEIFLAKFVNKSEVLPLKDIEKIQVDKVLSFNYTNTFEEVYLKDHYNHKCLPAVSYIHGKATPDEDPIIVPKNNNIVLGIEEYLPDEEKNKNLLFISYKKYFQRIYKETGNEYLDWVDKISHEWEALDPELKINLQMRISKHSFNTKSICHNDLMHFLYIFGHSLDVTDGDVFRRLILHDNVKTNIFYYREYENDKRDLKQKIANLVKIIGQDELIKRTGGSTRTIEFVPQSIPES